MGAECRAIYGFLQEPHMARHLRQTPNMDITLAISRNLTAWMEAVENLNTIKKVAAKSQVGFGTVRRAKNGDGNITVQNLEAIALAFGRRAIDLITPPGQEYASAPQPALRVAEAVVTPFVPADPLADYLQTLTELARMMTDEGRWRLIERADSLAQQYPRAKANPAS